MSLFDDLSRQAAVPGLLTPTDLATTAYKVWQNGERGFANNDPQPGRAGLRPTRFAEMYNQLAALKRSHRNLWSVVVSNYDGSDFTLPYERDLSDHLNLLAVDLSFGPVTLDGEKRKSFGAVLDEAQGGQATDVRMSVYDTKDGFLKEWFRDRASRVVHRDGTVGLPAEYLIRMVITQEWVDGREAPPDGERYQTKLLVRPVAMEIDLSREDGGSERVNLTFTQFDTFMPF